MSIREAVEVGDDEIALGKLAHRTFADGIQIKVVVAIALCFPNELVGVVGQEVGGTLRLHILVITVFENGLDEVTTDGIVFVEFQVVLTTVKYTDIDAFVVGIPGDGGEVLFGGFTRLDHDFLARGTERIPRQGPRSRNGDLGSRP